MKSVLDKISPIKAQLNGLEQDLKTRGDKPKYPLDSLPLLSKKIWGLKEGLTVLGARSSNGKSGLAMQIAYDLSSQNIPVLFLSLEMTVESILERLFCHHSKINNYSLESGDFSKHANKWKVFKQVVSELPLMITCGIGQSWQEVNFMVQELNPKPKCIIIDYVQGIATRTKENREMMNEYIRKFREMALLNKFVGILCSQINRGAMAEKNREPALWTLKETGSLEELADMVILMHYDYLYNYDETKEKEMKLIIAKSRNGKTGQHIIKYDPEFYQFSELKQEYEVKDFQKTVYENL
jgi:replicative DNA helicase